MNVIIVHGAYGHPKENWFDWMRIELEARGIPCYVPQLPTPENQSLEEWLKVFNQSVGHLINEETILIGHSLGAVFILRWLEINSQKLFSVILIGGFLGKVGLKKFDDINKSFFVTAFEWNKIIANNNSFICYYGDNDNYVSRNQFDILAKNLLAKPIIISNAGHFNQASGYTAFPHLFDLISRLRRDCRVD